MTSATLLQTPLASKICSSSRTHHAAILSLRIDEYIRNDVNSSIRYPSIPPARHRCVPLPCYNARAAAQAFFRLTLISPQNIPRRQLNNASKRRLHPHCAHPSPSPQKAARPTPPPSLGKPMRRRYVFRLKYVFISPLRLQQSPKVLF